MGVRGVAWLVLVALTLLTAAPVRAQAGDASKQAPKPKVNLGF